MVTVAHSSLTWASGTSTSAVRTALALPNTSSSRCHSSPGAGAGHVAGRRSSRADLEFVARIFARNAQEVAPKTVASP